MASRLRTLIVHDWNRNLPLAAILMLHTVARQQFIWEGQRLDTVQ